jgi:hypothetical protein
MAKARWSLSAGVILAIVAGAAGRDEFRPQVQRDPLSSFLVQSYGAAPGSNEFVSGRLPRRSWRSRRTRTESNAAESALRREENAM